ncbi:proto-oncogene tyrosine-protein kinase ROS-like isoform X2 [Formica exsecta]|uniref:proto-oncogene tyrosine-protein kinase ROS-like isoform X2 n=1 Tax=Formica exsecta TaxID=72781 RepID=UPI001143056B|nr:proto-oncogene tyrosine-protein kinase ROS-like isoform X2 [Formica exsecta]XP_029659968.1 proto-oncogene tyrosine-protein kinase ROS-like isoform X2 [Formica exsecta]
MHTCQFNVIGFHKKKSLESLFIAEPPRIAWKLIECKYLQKQNYYVKNSIMCFIESVIVSENRYFVKWSKFRLTVSESNDFHILQNLEYDWGHSDSVSVRNKVDKIPFANMSVILESTGCQQCKKDNEQVFPPIMTDIELAILHEIPDGNIQFSTFYNPMLQCNSDEYILTEIKREEISLEKLLGSGAFGKVFQGTVKNLKRPGIETPVAIKMLRENASSQEKKKFLEEARLMNRFRHKHVLRLLAVCLDKNSPLIVLELMEIGDLLQYLRDNRKLQPSDAHALRLQDLFAMCEDVARGCCYLENLRFVHRDLACRNCLVSARDRENRVIKIGDFGLDRNVYKDDY